LAKRALAADFRSIDSRCARIILIEAGPRLLASFHPSLSQAALHSLEQLGVEVRLGANVTDCDCSGVSLGQERLQTRAIIGPLALRPRLRANGSTPSVIERAA
jgi:NADH:quinone reductase (non-electrogenic)